MFPHELVPDGNVMAPHHYYYFLLGVLLVTAAVWDNYRNKEPFLVAALVAAGLFGFASVWPRWHVAGAILAVAAPILAIVIIASGWAGLTLGDVWDDYPRKYRLAAIVLLFAAWDDALDHAFAFGTPLDYIWNAGLNQYAEYVVTAALVAVFVYAAAGYFVTSRMAQ